MPVRPRLRHGLVLWHRWFGLLGGAWLFLLALSGSLLVFYQEIDRALNPDLWRLEVSGEPLPVAQLVAAAEAAHPGSYASNVDLPNEPTDPAVIYLGARQGTDLELPAGLHVFVDPYSGEVLGERVFGALRIDRRHFAHFLYQLHMNLFLGVPMTLFLGLVGFLWALDHVASVILSFPTPRKWIESFRVRRGARGFPLVYGLHRAGGLWLLPITLVLAVSGVYFNWYDGFRKTVSVVSPVTPRYYETAPVLDAPLYAPAVSVDRALDVARRRAGGAAVDAVSILPAQGLYWTRLFDEADLDSYGGRWIYVDMRSADIRADRHVAEGTAGDAVIAWQYPLHSGRAFGWPGRIAIFLAGLAVCGFTVTGFILWAKKRRARTARRALSRRATPALPLARDRG